MNACRIRIPFLAAFILLILFSSFAECIHSFSASGKITVQPTCTSDGEMHVLCQNNCGTVRIVRIPSIGHSFSSGGTVLRQPGCTLDGERAATCQNNCGEIRYFAIPATGHRYAEQGSVISHTSCTSDGVIEYACENGCGSVKRITIAKTGHSMLKTQSTESTCTEDGFEIYQCTNGCGYTETRTLPKTGHAYSQKGVVALIATCTQEGSLEYICENQCGSAVRKSVPATGHRFGEWTTTKRATCKSTGKKERTCELCHTSEEAVINRTTHEPGRWVISKGSGDEVSDIMTRYCTICGARLDVRTLSSARHEESSTLPITACFPDGAYADGYEVLFTNADNIPIAPLLPSGLENYTYTAVADVQILKNGEAIHSVPFEIAVMLPVEIIPENATNIMYIPHSDEAGEGFLIYDIAFTRDMLFTVISITQSGIMAWGISSPVLESVS